MNATPSRSDHVLTFVVLGIEHILIGYDHVLFLIGLLVLGGGLGWAVRIITAFTVAHSLTLAVAALQLLQLPGGLVEAAIAASIVYVGIENLLRRRAPHRWTLAFVFGLLHGFGFASVLGDLAPQVGAGVAWSLLGFNLGVELGQLGIAAVVLPLIWWAQRSAIYRNRVLPLISLGVATAGAIWLVERTLM